MASMFRRNEPDAGRQLWRGNASRRARRKGRPRRAALRGPERLEDRRLLATFQLLAGQPDNFAPPTEPTSASADLVASDQFPLMDFDVIPDSNNGFKDHKVAETFTGLFSGLPASVPFDMIRTGTLQLHVRAGAGGLAVDNDAVVLGFYGPGAPGEVWHADFPDLVSGWTNGTDATITLDLSNLPVSGGSPVDLIPDLNTYGFLDIKVKDDTGVDDYQATLQRVAVWDGGGDGSTWSQAANWVGDALPQPGDDVYIPDVAATTRVVLSTSASLRGLISDESITVASGGTLSVGAASQLNAGGTLSTGGTLTGSGDLTIGGAFNWNGGSLNGYGFDLHRRRGHDDHPGGGVTHGSDGRPLVAQPGSTLQWLSRRPERHVQYLGAPGRSPATGPRTSSRVVNNSGTVTDTATSAQWSSPATPARSTPSSTTWPAGVFDDQVDGRLFADGLSSSRPTASTTPARSRSRPAPGRRRSTSPSSPTAAGAGPLRRRSTSAAAAPDRRTSTSGRRRCRSPGLAGPGTTLTGSGTVGVSGGDTAIGVPIGIADFDVSGGSPHIDLPTRP